MDYSDYPWHNIPDLARLVSAGQVYSVIDVVTATAVLAANFVLFNPATDGTPVWLWSALVGMTVNDLVALYQIQTDPGLSAGNTIGNRLLNGPLGRAKSEAAAGGTVSLLSAGIAGGGYLGTPTDVVGMVPMIIPPGRGILVQCSPVAGSFSVTWLWSEGRLHLGGD